MKDAIIVDLHDTLMLKDEKLNIDVLDIIKNSKDPVIIISRNRSNEDKTEIKKWLDDNNVPFTHIYLSPVDMKEDKQVKVKEYILTQKILGKYNPVLAIDDKKKVRKMYDKYGIKTINPNDLS